MSISNQVDFFTIGGSSLAYSPKMAVQTFSSALYRYEPQLNGPVDQKFTGQELTAFKAELEYLRDNVSLAERQASYIALQGMALVISEEAHDYHDDSFGHWIKPALGLDDYLSGKDIALFLDDFEEAEINQNVQTYFDENQQEDRIEDLERRVLELENTTPAESFCNGAFELGGLGTGVAAGVFIGQLTPGFPFDDIMYATVLGKVGEEVGQALGDHVCD